MVGRDQVRLWDTRTGKARTLQLDEQLGVRTATFASDAQILAVLAADAVRLWDVPQGLLRATIPIHASTLAIAPDGKALATAGGKSVKLWQTDKGQPLTPVPDGPADVCSLAFSPKGNLLAWGRVDGTFGFCDPKNPQPRSHGGLQGRVQVGFASDGLLFLRGEDGTIKSWDVVRAREPAALPTAPSVSWAVSPNGRAVVTSGRDNVLRVWDVVSGKNTVTLERHTSPAHVLDYSADGQKLASAGPDGRVVVWDARQPMRFLGEWQFPGPVHKLVFSPDSRQLLAVNANGTVYLLRSPS